MQSNSYCTSSGQDRRERPDKKRAEILFVIGSLDVGGAERHLVQLAPLLKEDGWSPTVYCLTHGGMQRADLERQGVAVIGPPFEARTRHLLFRFFALVASCTKLLTILLRTRPQIIHFFLPLAYIVGAPLAIVSRVRTRLMSRRSLNHYQRKHPILSWFERKLHKHITVALGNSRAVTGDLSAEGIDPRRTRLIYNGIDLAPFDRSTPGIEGRRPPLVIIIVANLISYKGHAELVEAAGRISHAMPKGWQLWCVGRDDGLLQVLERLAKECNVEDNIKFLGPRTDIPSLLKLADISVLSSHEEGFSNAILEAMAAGLPVIATDVGGNSEAVVHGETGLIVPAKDPTALGEALLHLASNPQIRKSMGRAGRVRVEALFSIHRCAHEYSCLYTEILSRDPATFSDRPEQTINSPFPALRERLARFVRSKLVRTAFLLCVSFAALIAAVSQVGFAHVAATLADIPFVTLVAAAALMLVGAFVATLRLHFIAKDLGWNLSAKDALLALGVGQVASAASVQFFGQIVGRSAVLGSRGLSAPVNIAIVTYERLAAVGVSVTLAAISAWYLFGRIAIDLRSGGEQFLLIAAGIICAVVFSGAFGWGGLVRRSVLDNVTLGGVRALLRNMLLTLLIQLFTAGAYVALASTLSPDIDLGDLVAASLIVMFAASLPISFAGWGIRELSAVIALSAVGVPSGAAVATAITIGIFALLAVIMIATVASLMPQTKPLPQPKLLDRSSEIEGVVKWVLPVAAAIAVLFQLHVPMGSNVINVNLADPIVVLGGGVFALGYLITKKANWRLPNLSVLVLLSTCILGIALFNGFYRYGWIDWAFMNKGLGWLVLLCYGATGALIVHRHGEPGFILLSRTFAGAVCGIVLFAIAIILFRRVGVMLPRSWFAFPLAGFSQNRNAFALILTLAACLLPWMKREHQPWILGLYFTGLWLAGSRAAFGAIVVVIVLFVAAKQMSLSNIAKSLLGFAGIVAIVELTPIAFVFLTGQKIDPDAIPSVWSMTLSPPSSDQDRFKSIVDGLRMFLERPIIGNGLGAYIAEQKNAAQVVIHSTPVWLLAEMGLVGFLVFATPAVRIFQLEAKTIRSDPVSMLLVGMLVAFGIISAVHEMLYQRAIWLLLGAALSMTLSNRERST